MEDKKLNVESILKQFGLVESSINRAKLPFETDMLHEKVLEVSMYELMKAIEQMKNMIKEIGHPRFEPVITQEVHYPPLIVGALNVCPYCGDPECTSDHK